MALIISDHKLTIPICDEIIQYLYLGDYVAGHTRSIIQDMKLVINISNNSPPDENVDIININIDDDPHEDISIFNNKILNKENVLVYCMNSVSRSVSFVLLYIMKYNNMKYTTALEYLKTRRTQYYRFSVIIAITRHRHHFPYRYPYFPLRGESIVPMSKYRFHQCYA